MKPLIIFMILCTFPLTASVEANLIYNPYFAIDANGDDIPDKWRAGGNSKFVTQKLSIGKGHDNKRCVILSCTHFKEKPTPNHAMLSQMGVQIRSGVYYRVTLWARAEGIADNSVFIGINNTSTWASCGLRSVFSPDSEWKRFEFFFQSTCDCLSKTRFQIWFKSKGTLWVDDIALVPVEHRPMKVTSSENRTNLLPNASFESGISGWGSAEWDKITHWGGPMNRLFGVIDNSTALHGQSSLRINLTPENQPVSYFDYFDLHRIPIQAPLAANTGFVEVEPGRSYTFSAYLKSAEPDIPARLAIQQFDGHRFEQAVHVSPSWKRQSITFTPTSRWCYVLVGPDLRKTPKNPNPPFRATLWMDALQLEKGYKPSNFIPRNTLETGVTTGKLGNVFDWQETLEFQLMFSNCETWKRQVRIEMWLTDFFDNEVWRSDLELSVPAQGKIKREVTLEPSEELRGFLRLHVKIHAGDMVSERMIRLAVIPFYKDDDSRFGINHAYPWPHLLDLSRNAGLLWVRDWSLKWQEVEPSKGHFTFVETDHQINRPLDHGIRILAMLPFPSSSWSSSAPPAMRTGKSIKERRSVMAWAPRNTAEFEGYVERTVAHYKNRITWFQVFNEPLFTSYALPRKNGYDGTDYAQYTKAFVKSARRANPQCKILAGIGALRTGQILEDFRRFFEKGGLEAIDAVDIHYYPRVRPPEFIEPLLKELNALMQKHGDRKPIWLTEYGYYADDEPWVLPMSYKGFNHPLQSEKLQAAYAVRWATIVLANGVEKIFYHAGTCGGINSDSLQGIFFEYGGTVHKIYAAQAFMAQIFSPSCQFVKRLPMGDGIKCYLFRDMKQLIAVVWSVHGVTQKTIYLKNKTLIFRDIMGRKQTSRSLTLSAIPAYIIGNGISVEDFEQATL